MHVAKQPISQSVRARTSKSRTGSGTRGMSAFHPLQTLAEGLQSAQSGSISHLDGGRNTGPLHTFQSGAAHSLNTIAAQRLLEDGHLRNAGCSRHLMGGGRAMSRRLTSAFALRHSNSNSAEPMISPDRLPGGVVRLMP